MLADTLKMSVFPPFLHIYSSFFFMFEMKKSRNSKKFVEQSFAGQNTQQTGTRGIWMVTFLQKRVSSTISLFILWIYKIIVTFKMI